MVMNNYIVDYQEGNKIIATTIEAESYDDAEKEAKKLMNSLNLNKRAIRNIIDVREELS
ncbi:hypothetical protein [Methanobrevibacter sp. DSM 116169]|uniref:hypothetical protein n=1 Tax=Methanobrevibacter sp. DSM 116169 TaxID=3242727 RepID=UPI0038FC61EA